MRLFFFFVFLGLPVILFALLFGYLEREHKELIAKMKAERATKKAL